MKIDYLKELGYKPMAVLVEDNLDLNYGYWCSLGRAGFEVVPLDNASKLEKTLKRLSREGRKAEIIMSDTDTNGSYGDEICRDLLDKGVIGQDVLVLGMSDNADNEEGWRGVAHANGFYDKNRSNFNNGEMGETVMSHYYGFAKGESSMWKMRML